MNLVSPLNRVLGLGSAKGGFRHWWTQRLTGAALVLLGLWFVIALAGMPALSYAAVTDWLAAPHSAILMIMLVWCLVYHSYLGVEVVIEDYVHGKATKTIALVLLTFLHFALGIAGLYAVLKIGFGA